MRKVFILILLMASVNPVFAKKGIGQTSELGKNLKINLLKERVQDLEERFNNLEDADESFISSGLWSMILDCSGVTTELIRRERHCSDGSTVVSYEQCDSVSTGTRFDCTVRTTCFELGGQTCPVETEPI